MKTLAALLFLIIIPLVSYSQDSRNNPVKIYPNPTQNEVTIEGLVGGVEKLIIYDSYGNSILGDIKITVISESEVVCDLSTLPRGVYYFKANSIINKVYKE